MLSTLCGEMDVFVLIIHFKLPRAEVHFENPVSATGLTEEHYRLFQPVEVFFSVLFALHWCAAYSILVFLKTFYEIMTC